MEAKKYLTHVNALRGLAILLVFLYHLREPWCPQGFLGVDAFFVISGYFLIPSLVKRHYKGGEFLWMNYYKSKITRILPPLVTMTLVALLAAIPLMIASDLLNAGSTARTVITGLSNVYLGLAATDYFAPGVKENIFLHTWYIAVLIQVLIAAPFLCRPISRLRPIWVYSILGAVALASLVIFFQQWLPRAWQDELPGLVREGGRLGSVYYMTAGRLWEIIAGAFVGLLPAANRRGLRSLLSSLGFLLLLIPCFWPQPAGGFALCAVVGTILIIRYGADTHMTRFAENRLIMWLGTVSFSLYLIHWPTMALARYALMRDFTLLDCAWVTALSLLLTWALYHGVEKRCPRILLIAFLWVLTMALALFIRKTDGLKNYVHVEVNAMREYTSTDYKDWEFAPQSSWVGPYPKELNAVGGHYGDPVLDEASPYYGHAPILQIGDRNKQPNFVLLGDSYANALFPGFDIVAKREGWSGLYLNLYMTPFWGRLNVENPGLETRFTKAKAVALMEWLKSNPHLRYVIVNQRWYRRFVEAETWNGEFIPESSAWPVGEEALRQFCEQVRSANKELIFILPTPEPSSRVSSRIMSLVKRSQLWYNPSGILPDFSSTKAQYDDTNHGVCALLWKMKDLGYCTIIDPVPCLFNNGMFDPVDGDDLIIYDAQGHLSVHGSLKLLNALRSQFAEILNR